MGFEEWLEQELGDDAERLCPNTIELAERAWEASQAKWQPIETAPKDTAVICCNELGHVGEACFISGIDSPAWYWASDPQQIPLSLQPTHWMPLPSPPKERQ